MAGAGFWKPHIAFLPIGAVLTLLGVQLISRGVQARLAHRRGRSGDSR